MKSTLLVLVCAAASTLLAQTAPPKTHLKIGDKAPEFTIDARSNTGGKDIKLADYKGQKNVVLAFFPAAFTGG
jgi:peroxiredoxin